MTARPAETPCGDGATPTARPELARIGKPRLPIRAIAFGGGGFDTAMQLGVIHALLVSRGKPPDVVIGSSTGAVNAVALAEVFQAGNDLARRVERFRQLYEGYRSAPGQLAQAFKPDFFQVDTQRPLDPLLLPIHHEAERRERSDAVLARAGLINLYNTVLALRLTLGTLTRGIRRVLGIAAARDDTWLRGNVATIAEGFRGWLLVGRSLHNLPALVWPALRALVRRRFGNDRGATAGELIFRSAVVQRLSLAAKTAVSLLLLVILWLGGALSVLLGLAILGSLAGVGWALWRPGFWPAAGVAVGAGALLAVVVTVWWSRASWWRALGAALWTLATFAGLVLGWTLALATLAVVAGAAVAMRNGTVLTKPWLGSHGLWIVTGVGALVVFLGICGLVWWRRAVLFRWILAQFDLDEAIFSNYPLRQILISLFDPEYHGPVDMDAVVDKALKRDPSPRTGPLSEKRLDAYAAVRDPAAGAAATPPIHVLLGVVDLATGRFKVLPGWWRVVDGLTAALATVPWFSPVAGDDGEAKRMSLLVDASVVAHDPTRPLFAYLRGTPNIVNEEAAVLHLYTVAPLPFSRQSRADREPALENHASEYTTLVDGALRALELRRFRDASLERRLTELATWTMPRTDPKVFYPAALEPTATAAAGETRRLLRSWVYVIEPERPLRVSRRVLAEDDEEKRRRIVAETVADGCRTALQVMLEPTINRMANPVTEQYRTQERFRLFATGGLVKILPCGAAIREHLGGADPLPGSAAGPHPDEMNQLGPGLAEVCRHCALFRDPSTNTSPKELRRSLRALDERDRGIRPWPQEGWPREGAPEQPWAETQSTRYPTEDAEERQPRLEAGSRRDRWPRERGGQPGHERPTVSLLFSGGVFRGVFQVGALNALSEVNLVPDIVAGASVGSITAAMVARAFVRPQGLDDGAILAARRRQVLRVAATYLGVDRLVLTDRFADFIRSVTVRAAQAGFSVRDADRMMRRLDAARPGQFSREMRRVMAGIERLTYISPLELWNLVVAFRLQKFGKAVGLLRADFQEWLERVGVGDEILGSEPLALLIRENVLEGLADVAPETVGLDAFIDHGMFFLATTTNLTTGRLHTLGANQLDRTGSEGQLLESLLASSAFPGVFRPRRAWEVFPGTPSEDLYIDGGVMDNLPLDAVAQFLHTAAQADVVARRPGVPHLLFCASLEEQVKPAADAATLDDLRYNWPRLLRHARRVGYNEKLRIYGRTQRNLRGLARTRGEFGAEWTPLDLEVVAVIPRWLCSTFGFHPMLGFRRRKQAQSIAHGCASTLHTLAATWHGHDGAKRLAGWGVDTARLPQREPDGNGRVPFTASADVPKGHCWYQPTGLCPFSEQGQEASRARVPEATRRALAEIYDQCRKPETHLP